ncbi:hypothetical protein H4K36_02045 [Streptomyces sp. DHE7-1]|nr:hypothetical protein [Streptomyces sp. DHE7-1]
MSDTAQFEHFYATTFRRVVGHVYLITGDTHAAEDCTQEAFSRAVVRWDRIRAYDAPGDTAASIPQESDLAAVVGARMPFWEALAHAQGRPCAVTVAPGPLGIGLSEDDLVAALDALLGNVFQHTPPGSGCEVYAGVLDGVPSLVVEDAGPGITGSETVRVRGLSGGESSGLGLDIAARAAENAGGRLVIGTARHGGARVEMRFGQPEPAHRRWSPEDRRRSGMTGRCPTSEARGDAASPHEAWWTARQVSDSRDCLVAEPYTPCGSVRMCRRAW